MLLRNTKKFFQKTIEGFKSFLSPGRGSGSGSGGGGGAGILCSYHRLPKTPPLNLFSSCGHRREAAVDMESNVQPCYQEDQDNYMDDAINPPHKELNSGHHQQRSKPSKNRTEYHQETAGNPSTHKKKMVTILDQSESKAQKFIMNKSGGTIEGNPNFNQNSGEYHGRRKGGEGRLEAEMSEMRHARLCWIAQRLKEMEMVDKSNVDHLLDIEEVLHYYSRLSLPTYMDIVDKFLVELYGEFFGAQQQEHYRTKNISSSPSNRLAAPFGKILIN